MKLNKTTGNITDEDDVAGLFTAHFDYEIKNTKASMTWKGPKIPPEVWHQVLNFFQWTYDTTKSESQVRLFVSPVHNTWKAWAFPQEAKTGLSAREIDGELKNQQRASLNLQYPEWIPFGTVHHHCGLGAFQSGTDRDDEKDQDGLHITIGKMDSPVYDMHARFYRKGMMWEKTLDMSWFFDVGDPVTQCPEQFRVFLPENLLDKMARRLMTQKVVCEFPEVWKTNLIDKNVKFTPVTPTTSTGTGSTQGLSGPSRYSSGIEPLWQRAEAAWKEIAFEVQAQEIDVKEVEEALDVMNLDPIYTIFVKACMHHKCDPDDLARHMAPDIEEKFAQIAVAQQLAEEQAEKEDAATPPKPPQLTLPPGGPDGMDGYGYQ